MDWMRSDRGKGVLWILAVLGLIAVNNARSLAQSPPSEVQSASAPSPPLPSPNASRTQASEPETSATPNSSQALMEERLRKMEEAYRRMEDANRKIQSQYDSLSKRYDELSRRVSPDASASTSTTRPVSRVGAVEFQQPPTRDELSGIGARGMGGRTAPGPSLSGGEEGVERRGLPLGGAGPPPFTMDTGQGLAVPGISSRARAGIGAQGTDGRVFPPEMASKGEEKIKRRMAKVEFAEGLELSSEDEEFKLTFHNLTQAEFRGFPSDQQGILKSQFFIPRQRWYFTGRVTRNVEFYTVINRGYGALDVLDAFISYRFDERLRIRAGRMKTPYLYEYFSIAEGDLIAPERSLFAGNMAGNRQMGVMALGELRDGKYGYAIGVFNGPRRSFEDYNSAKDLIGEFNARPFLKSERYKALNYLNMGGSFIAGYEDNPTSPFSLRTANDQSTSPAAASLSPTFLTFNSNVVERGQRNQWGAHVAWYYKSLFLLAEYGGGRAGYGLANQNFSTAIPFEGYSVVGSYFLTGEEITRRVSVVKPRRDFSLKRGSFGLGAIETYARFAALNFDRSVFTSGFADPNLWSNHAWTTDIGLNWYLNFYTKIYLDWQHSEFGNSVVIGPNHFGRARDLFWLRFQVFF